MFNMFVWFYYIFLISDLNTCLILMYDHANQSLGPPLQKYRGPIKHPKMAKTCPKIANISNFQHDFAILRHLIGPLVAKLLHVLVEKVLSFKISGVSQNQTSIKFRNEENVIELPIRWFKCKLKPPKKWEP